MNISYYFKNLEATDALKDYAAEKMSRLEDRLHHIEGIDVRFQLLRQNQIFEVTVHADATVFHVRKTEKDMYAAIDVALDALLSQIDKHRRKLDEKNPTHETHHLIPSFDKPPVSDENTISVHEALAKPMDDLEAVLQLKAGRFRFRMFHHSDEKKYSMISIRPDGHYSIISPMVDDRQYREKVISLSEDNRIEIISESLYPMSRSTVAEAIDMLEENNLDFLGFVNEETGRLNVIFHGKHGELVIKRPPL